MLNERWRALRSTLATAACSCGAQHALPPAHPAAAGRGAAVQGRGSALLSKLRRELFVALHLVWADRGPRAQQRLQGEQERSAHRNRTEAGTPNQDGMRAACDLSGHAHAAHAALQTIIGF